MKSRLFHSMTRKKRIFLRNAFILMFCSFFMRALGVGFSSFLSDRMGSEGMGLFQLISAVYGLASTFATSGIYLTVTRLTAEEISRGNYAGADDALKKCIRYGLVVSLISAVFLFCFSVPIGEKLLGDCRSVLSLKILAFSLPFMSFSSSLRGYFFALRKAEKSSLSQITEQIANIAAAITAFHLLLPGKDLRIACAAVSFGCAAGELISFLLSFSLYVRDRKKKNFTPQSSPDITCRMLRITLPVALSTSVKSILRTIENLLIPRGLRVYGASDTGALAQYGMTEAMVMPILTFPAAFLTSFSSLLIPDLAEARSAGNSLRISRIAAKVLRLTLIFSTGITGIFVLFSHELGIAIYRSAAVGGMLRVLAPITPLLYLDLVADAMLKGLDQQISVLKYSMIDSALSIGLYWFLLPLYGVKGYIVVLYASTFLNSTLSVGKLSATVSLRIQPFQWVLLPAFCIIAAAFASKAVISHGPKLSSAPSVILLIGLSILFYLIFLFFFNCIFRKKQKHPCASEKAA